MIATLLGTIGDDVATVFVVVVLVAGVAGGVALRLGERGRRVLWVLAGISAVAAAVLTLAPANNPSEAVCTIDVSWPDPGAAESAANILLLLPAALFAALATRRPLRVLLVAVACSAAIELAQALVAAMGRSCDTNDLWMNAIGAAVGVGVAAIVRGISRRRGPDLDLAPPTTRRRP